MTRPHSLHVDTGSREQRAETHLLVDGADLLVHEQVVRSRRGPWTYLPADPVGLLPPDSRALLPATEPAPVMVGICTCGEPGCGSLWMRVRRDGDTAVWEPLPDAPRASIRHTYRFPLIPYLDAIDDGARRARVERPRLLARQVRARRDSLFGPMVDGELINARAWPSTDWISVEVAPRSAFHRIPVGTDDSVETVLARLRDAIADKRGILGAMTAAEPPLTPRVETILRMARAEAASRGHTYTGAEHLMLALLTEGRSVPAQVLAGQIPLADVRAALEELMASDGYSGR